VRLGPAAGSTLSRVIESLRASRRMAVQTRRRSRAGYALPHLVTNTYYLNYGGMVVN
jgi:hypothetical protein